MENRKVFIASPSDLSMERQLISEISLEINCDNMNGGHHSIEIVDGFKQTSQIGRAQSVINALLRECDYCIVMFKNKWGSAPSPDTSYSSGTEEEFFEALKCVIDENYPMKNVSVVFFSGDDSQDEEVQKFRDKLTRSYSFLYEEIRPNEEQDKIRAILSNLNMIPRGGAYNLAELTTLSGKAVLRPVTYLQKGRDEYASGNGKGAGEYFEKAAEFGEYQETLELVKFYRKSGDLKKAQDKIDSTLIEIVDKLGSGSKQYLLFIEQRIKSASSKKEVETAVIRLENNIRKVSDIPIADIDDYSRLYDLLGHHYRHRCEFSNATYFFEKSHAQRRRGNRKAGIFMSLLNFATVERELKNLNNAVQWLDEAEEYIRHVELGEKARFYLCKAQVKTDQRDFITAKEAVQQSLSFNEASDYKQGKAYSYCVWAKIEELEGDLNTAKTLLEKAHALNETMGHADGVRMVEQRLKTLEEIGS